MLDESLPTFFYKRSPDGLLHNTAIFFSQHGSEPEAAYSLHRADPFAAYAKNSYAAAILDSWNPEVLYGEVLIEPEWSQPTLSAEEIRRNGGVPPPPVPIVPTEFTIQLYNPDQRVTITQKPGTWGGSASYEFSLPQTTFRTPSASDLDRTRNDPAASATTPKINFVWRKESKLAKDLTCYMTGKSTDTLVKKRHRDPDITVALYRSFREVTIYEPNLYRVELEDPKGLEVVLLLGAAVIKDLYFNHNIDSIFNVSEMARQSALAGVAPPPHHTNSVATRRKELPLLPKLQTVSPTPAPVAAHAPSQTNPRTQWEIDAETARLRAQVEAEERHRRQQEAARRREREKADEAETRRLQKMVEAEQREAQKRQEAIDRETERLRKEYGVRPPREGRHSAPNLGPIPQGRPVSQPQRQTQYLQPGQQQQPYMPPRGSNGLYLQPNPSSYASSSAVMSGANPHAVASPTSPDANRMKKKVSFFGLRSNSDDSGRKLSKKASAVW